MSIPATSKKMVTKNGAGGVVHTVHVAGETDSGELENFREVENVLDAVNMPNGTIKFTKQGEPHQIEAGKIVRTTVKGLDDAARYRCPGCENIENDLLSAVDRGPFLEVHCSECGEKQNYERTDMDDI